GSAQFPQQRPKKTRTPDAGERGKWASGVLRPWVGRRNSEDNESPAFVIDVAQKEGRKTWEAAVACRPLGDIRFAPESVHMQRSKPYRYSITLSARRSSEGGTTRPIVGSRRLLSLPKRGKKAKTRAGSEFIRRISAMFIFSIRTVVLAVAVSASSLSS